MHQIFNTYISGGTAHVAAPGSSSTANTVNTSSLNHSPVQQAGAHSALTLTFSAESQQRTDIEKLVREVSAHLSDLNLDARGQRKVEAQLATINAQLADEEPDAGIISQAGRTLRNVTEGAIGSLIATALQPGVWHWVAQALPQLFPS